MPRKLDDDNSSAKPRTQCLKIGLWKSSSSGHGCRWRPITSYPKCGQNDQSCCSEWSGQVYPGYLPQNMPQAPSMSQQGMELVAHHLHRLLLPRGLEAYSFFMFLVK